MKRLAEVFGPIVEIGPYCLTIDIARESVAVTRYDEPLYEDQSKWAVPPTYVPGIAKLVAKGVAYKLFDIDGMDVIYIIQRGHKYGFGCALNITEPYFSEFGDTGVVVPK